MFYNQPIWKWIIRHCRTIHINNECLLWQFCIVRHFAYNGSDFLCKYVQLDKTLTLSRKRIQTLVCCQKIWKDRTTSASDAHFSTRKVFIPLLGPSKILMYVYVGVNSKNSIADRQIELTISDQYSWLEGRMAEDEEQNWSSFLAGQSLR